MNELITHIPSVNAWYLLDSQPYHVYVDSARSIYEVLVHRVSGNVNWIIAEFFHDRESRWLQSSSSSVLLTPDWYFFSLENPLQRVGVEHEMFQRLLNPTDWSGWQYQRHYAQRRIPDNYFKKTYPKTQWPISLHAFVAEKVSRIQAHW